MKNAIKVLSLGMVVFLAFACQKDNSIHIDSKVILSELFTSGKIGDMVNASVTFNSDEISKLVITKLIDGVESPGFKIEVPVNGTSSSYAFSQMILVGDELGTLVFTFSGYNASGGLVDASDLAVAVTLSGVPLLTKYDWRLASQTTLGENTMKPGMDDNVYRFNTDYSWQYDWGTAPGLDVLNQYCAWKIIGNESKIDSLHLIHYGFLTTIPTYTKYQVIKLEGEDLWLQAFIDLSVFGPPYTAETPVIEKYVGIARSPGFTPYRGEDAANYTWAPCNPGSY